MSEKWWWGGKSTTNQPCYEQQRYIVELHFKCQGDVSVLFTLVWVEAVPWSPPGRWTLVAAGLGTLLVSLKLDWFLGGKAPCKRPMPPLHPWVALGSCTHKEENARDVLG